MCPAESENYMARSIKSPGRQWLQLPMFGDQKCDMAFFVCYTITLIGLVETLKVGYRNLDVAVILATDSVSLERALNYAQHRDDTHWSSKSRKLHLPPSLPTFHILLVLLVPRKPILAQRETSPKPAEGGKG